MPPKRFWVCRLRCFPSGALPGGRPGAGLIPGAAAPFFSLHPLGRRGACALGVPSGPTAPTVGLVHQLLSPHGRTPAGRDPCHWGGGHAASLSCHYSLAVAMAMARAVPALPAASAAPCSAGCHGDAPPCSHLATPALSPVIREDKSAENRPLLRAQPACDSERGWGVLEQTAPSETAAAAFPGSSIPGRAPRLSSQHGVPAATPCNRGPTAQRPTSCGGLQTPAIGCEAGVGRLWPNTGVQSWEWTPHATGSAEVNARGRLRTLGAAVVTDPSSVTATAD